MLLAAGLDAGSGQIVDADRLHAGRWRSTWTPLRSCSMQNGVLLCRRKALRSAAQLAGLTRSALPHTVTPPLIPAARLPSRNNMG